VGSEVSVQTFFSFVGVGRFTPEIFSPTLFRHPATFGLIGTSLSVLDLIPPPPQAYPTPRALILFFGTGLLFRPWDYVNSIFNQAFRA